METILMILAVLSLMAFVVSMFSPQTVKCASRGKAALIFLSAFAVCTIIGAAITERPLISEKAPTTGTGQTGQAARQETRQEPKELKALAEGDVITLPYADGEVKISFKEISINRTPKGLNLVLTVRIKNDSSEAFFISNAKWKLLDSEKFEVEESGIYEPMFDDFAPGMFFFTVVEPMTGKEESVGYSVNEGTYYLSLSGHIVAKAAIAG